MTWRGHLHCDHPSIYVAAWIHPVRRWCHTFADYSSSTVPTKKVDTLC